MHTCLVFHPRVPNKGKGMCDSYMYIKAKFIPLLVTVSKFSPYGLPHSLHIIYMSPLLFPVMVDVHVAVPVV